MKIVDAIILAAVLAIGTFLGRVLFWLFVVFFVYISGVAYDSSDAATKVPTYLYAASPQHSEENS